MNKFNYIVLDLEWNQSYYPKDSELSNEIIEIGAYKLDCKYNIIDYFYILVKPQVLKKMHFKVEKITQINYKMLKDKLCFLKAFENFFSWCGEDFIICTWSNSDILVLKSNLKFYNWDYKFLKNNIDLQKLYSKVTENSSNQYGLEKIIDKLEILSDRPFHKALNDAYYTSLILKNLNIDNLENYLKDFSSNLNPKVKIKKAPTKNLVTNEVREKINLTFNNKTEVFGVDYINDLICPICGEKIEKTINWIQDKNHLFVCLGFCNKDGNIFSQIKLFKNNYEDNHIKKLTGLANSRRIKSIKFKKKIKDKINSKKSK